MNQLVSAAVGEKLAALLTVDYLEERASRGSHRAYRKVLRTVRDDVPEPRDVLPNRGMQEATWQGRHDKRVKTRRGSG